MPLQFLYPFNYQLKYIKCQFNCIHFCTCLVRNLHNAIHFGVKAETKRVLTESKTHFPPNKLP